MSLVVVTPEFLRAHPLPTHEQEGDKQARGRVLVIAGSVEVAGAVLLAGLGVLRAGAGILQIATCRSVASHLAMAMPEAMVVGVVKRRPGILIPRTRPA
jgi:ADP-dependent NAD(P)H-hydrate dehydratase